MGLLNPYDDPTGQLTQRQINAQNIQNILTEFNRSQDQLDTLNKTFSIATILNVSYTFTDANYNSQFARFSFPHGLGFAPQVIGSWLPPRSTTHQILPVFNLENKNYFGLRAPSYSVEIESTDTINVNMRFDAYDAAGLSVMLSNGTLKLKLYCLQESVVTI